MGFFGSLLVMYIVLSISLYGVFQKAGVEAWKALIPGLNFMVWADLIGRSRLHPLLLLFPLVNIFILAGMCVDLVRSFNKYKFWHSFVAVVLPPLAFFYLGFSKKEKYDSPIIPREAAYAASLEEAKASGSKRKYEKLVRENPFKKSGGREWAESIIFAVFAAAFIRMFLIEAYVIPTPSMEGSLLVGDYLFVSKVHYGVRMPQTIAMLPLLHNRIPIINKESYLKKPQLPYKRLKALESIDNNDLIVFNYPAGDSVYIFPERTWTAEDYRLGSIANPSHVRAIKSGRTKLVTRPNDKKDHYVKRAVGVAGDSLQVIDRQVYINGKPGVNPKNMQFAYTVFAPNGLNQNKLKDLDIDFQRGGAPNSYLMFLSDTKKEELAKIDDNIRIEHLDIRLFDRDPKRLFPHDPANFPGWNNDNYGPIYIPKAGATVDISTKNISLYSRIIGVYENNDLVVKDGKVYINGEEATSYTFKMNYYWAMGDNRHNSEDSRVWGFVPEDHIVGKPLFIWFSTKDGSMSNGINWDRIFTSASKQ